MLFIRSSHCTTRDATAHLLECPKSNLTTPNAGESVEQQERPLTARNGTATSEDSFSLLTKLNILLPYDPAITLLGIHPKKLKAYVHTKTCTQMFIAALFIIVKTWKQPRHPSVGERIKKKRTVIHVENETVFNTKKK